MRLQLLLLALGVCVFAQTKPNSQIRIYQSAFQFLTKATCHIANAEVSKLGKNFITFNTTLGSNEVILKTSLSVDKFVCPTLDSHISDKDGIHFTSRQGEWSMKGLWSAVYHHPFGLPIDSAPSGDAVLSVKELDVDLAAKIVVKDNHPQLQMGECKAKLGVFDYKFNGKMADLPNMFNGFLGTIVKNIVKDLACQITKNTILAKYNEVIAKIPLHYQLPYNFSLDWALYEPKYANNLVEMKGAAKIAYSTKPCESQVTYNEAFEEFKNGESPKDVVIWLGQSLTTCALKSVHESQLIRLPINKDNLPDYAEKLKTNCGIPLIHIAGTCIGAALSGLRGVGKYAELLLYTHEVPQINLKKGVIEISAKFAMEVYEYPMKDHPKVLGKLIIGATANVKPKIVNKKLIGECDTDDIEPQISFEKGYKIKEFSFGYEKISKFIFKKVSKILFFAILQAGLPLPALDGAAISDKTQIEVFDKVVRINMGFELNGK